MIDIDWGEAPEWAEHAIESDGVMYWVCDYDREKLRIQPLSGGSDWLAMRDSSLVQSSNVLSGRVSTVWKPKQDRYTKDGKDWIDKCAETFTVDEFRGAMKFTIGKYLERVGKKDAIELEVYKMADYCDRWLQYERGLNDD